MKKDHKCLGFTLIELLVAIAIIGLLAAIALSAYFEVTKRSRDAKRKADMKTIATAAEVFYAQYDRYPIDVTELITRVEGGTFPQDPKLGGAAYLYSATTDVLGSNGTCAGLTATTVLSKCFTVCARLEKLGTGNAADTIGTEVVSGDWHCERAKN